MLIRPARSVAFIALAAVGLFPLTAAAQTQPTTPPAQPQPAPPAAPSSPPPGTTAPMQIPAVPAVPSVGGGTALPLVDAVRRALEQNLGVRQAALAVAIARSQVTQAQAGLYPTVGVGASNTQQTAPGNSFLNGTINIQGVTQAGGVPFTAVVPGSAPPQWNVHGTISYNVYTGNAVQDQIAIAK